MKKKRDREMTEKSCQQQQQQNKMKISRERKHIQFKKEKNGYDHRTRHIL